MRAHVPKELQNRRLSHHCDFELGFRDKVMVSWLRSGFEFGFHARIGASKQGFKTGLDCQIWV